MTTILSRSTITSWWNWTPSTHTERALKFGPAYILIDSVRIGVPIGKSGMLKAYDLDQFEAFITSVSWSWTGVIRHYETLLDELFMHGATLK